jgi:hypothetical protein
VTRRATDGALRHAMQLTALLATAMSAATIALAATADACGGSGGTAYVAHTFQSPSGNIACDYQVGFGGDDNIEVVQCEVRDHAWVAPAATCTGAYNDEQRASNAAGGDEFSLIGGKPSRLGCYWGFGGPLSTPNGKTTLEYGQTLSVGAITCDSEPSGVTCTDSSTGHFFRVSRESYELG